ncbi:argininosuccinate lyase [Lutispora saccharofermentans]|uniref:Argininosuccinate lyase n=1 Tax=Lutispora saccharofermentans TaxID=3024236 RepID=A0ABT1NCE4_9FIRM|nr:argininosuccinate lyase [Lutispora saccharofermentans]MCQ1528806.1 argininosuccinate lyase [Lutispora saccharofermentans]
MKLWGGRFEKNTNEIVDSFQNSIKFDYRMYKQDIKGSIAHAGMLGYKGIIGQKDAETIIKGLAEILADIEAGKVEFKQEAEDIHMNIESLLIEKIGQVGKKLHTGRSRNDQVALDFRMYLKEEMDEIIYLIKELCSLLLKKAEENAELIMPGYTHMQKAQPITLGHHLMAYFHMFCRDMNRFHDCYGRTDVMPLGSGALAGTTYDLDREMVAKELGFGSISGNSMDAVGDRDFVIEFISGCSILMMHLSRFCEELVLWNSHEFGYIEMDDSMSTGSSIMPQKKNPDVAELIRGKTGRVYGDLMAMLTIMKALPLAYNKDMQEDKEAAFDAADTVKNCIAVFIPMFDTITFNKEKIKEKLKGGFLNATDAADYLVYKGVAFRDAHEAIGGMVNYCIKNKKALEDLSLEELKTFNPSFESDIYEYISMESCVLRRNTAGGPSPKRVLEAIEEGKRHLDIIISKD